jgi:hypothetical protein
MKFILLPLLSLLTCSAVSQSAAIQWKKTFGGVNNDAAYATAPTADGGYVVVGQTQAINRYDTDAWMAKIDAQGTLVWQKVIGGRGSDQARGVIVLQDGRIVVVGSTSAAPSSDTDGLLVILSGDGNLILDQRFGSGAYDAANAVVYTRDECLAIAGTQFVDDNSRIWLTKLKLNGEKVWEKNFAKGDGEAPDRDDRSRAQNLLLTRDLRNADTKVTLSQMVQTELTATSYAEAYTLAQLPDGDLLVGGYAPGKGFGADSWLVKTDPNGNKQWEKIFGGGGTDEVYTVLAAGPAQGYAIGSSLTDNISGKGNVQGYVSKFQVGKDMIWEQTYGDSLLGEPNFARLDYIRGATTAANGGIILVGSTGYEPVSFTAYFIAGSDTMHNDRLRLAQENLRQLMKDPIKPEERRFEGLDFVEKQDGNGNKVTFRTPGPNEKRRKDAWVLCIDANGKRLWSNHFGGDGDDEFRSAIPTADGGYLLVGFTRSEGAGQSDAWVVKVK